MSSKLFLPILLTILAAAASSAGAPAQTSQANTANKPAAQIASHNQAQGSARQAADGGQRIFNENCSRCHAAPEGFSPRIASTIVRHMRVRASLSKHDAEELMRFFNP